MPRERAPVMEEPVRCTAANLTPRITQTLELLLDGGSEKEMAVQLGVSRHTVHVYVKSLYRHFGVCSRAELMALVLKALLRSVTRGNRSAPDMISAALRQQAIDAQRPTLQMDAYAERQLPRDQ